MSVHHTNGIHKNVGLIFMIKAILSKLVEHEL